MKKHCQFNHRSTLKGEDVLIQRQPTMDKRRETSIDRTYRGSGEEEGHPSRRRYAITAGWLVSGQGRSSGSSYTRHSPSHRRNPHQLIKLPQVNHLSFSLVRLCPLLSLGIGINVGGLLLDVTYTLRKSLVETRVRPSCQRLSSCR